MPVVSITIIIITIIIIIAVVVVVVVGGVICVTQEHKQVALNVHARLISVAQVIRVT